MKGTLAMMTRKRRRLGKYLVTLGIIEADKQDNLDRCWSGKSLSTPRTESASCHPSVILYPFLTSSLYMLVTWLY